MKTERGIDQIKCAGGGDQSGYRALGTRHEPRPYLAPVFDDEVRRDVASAAKIFFKRAAHDRFDEQAMRRTRKW
jgi:hypothetical protein